MRAPGSIHEIDRTRRVSELIRRELATLIARQVDDGRVKMVSITAVTVSKDLKQATVHVSSVEGSGAGDDAGEASERDNITHDTIERVFNHASKYLRYLLSQRIDLRSTPSLLFKYDHSIRKGMAMSHLIDSVNKKNAAE